MYVPQLQKGRTREIIDPSYDNCNSEIPTAA